VTGESARVERRFSIGMGLVGVLIALLLFEVFLYTYFLRECNGTKTIIWTALASLWFLAVPTARVIMTLIAVLVFAAAGFAYNVFRPRWTKLASGIVLTVAVVVGATWIYVPADLGGCTIEASQR
jgi:hypothetical protein